MRAVSHVTAELGPVGDAGGSARAPDAVGWRAPSPGYDRVGRYSVLAEIGRGGMGAVFVAASPGPDGFRKLVALKTLLPHDRNSGRASDMLLDEARTAARLHHPNIAQLYELGQDGDVPFLVMEYVHGESLASVLSACRELPLELAIWIACAVCDALEYARELPVTDDTRLGLVHRDVSPQNILVAYDGTPKLVDFGIARANGRLGVTEEGVVKGRWEYMAPEQRLGQPVDSRADVYALGMVLREMISGVSQATLQERPARAAGPADRLWQVIRRATEPDRDERYATPGEMLCALRELAASLAVQPTRASMQLLLQSHFAEQRALKEHWLECRDACSDAPTEPVPVVTSETARTGSRTRSSKLRGKTRWLSALVPIALFAGFRLMRDTPTTAAAVARPGPEARICLLGDAAATPEAKEQAWVLVRMLGEDLERVPGLVPVHGYRAQDRFGWTADGRRKAEHACRGARASTLVVISVAGDGRATLAVGDSQLASSRDALGSTSATFADVVARALGAAPPPREHAALDDATAIRIIRVRDSLYLQKRDDASDNNRDAAIREAPELDEPYLADALARWWNGELDDPAAREALRRPSRARVGAGRLLDAISALAVGEMEKAGALASRVLEDHRYRRDPLTLYITGEAFVHGSRPGEGVVLLEQALLENPQLMPAAYHVVERRLAEGDFEGVRRIADLWERADPSDPRAAELRAFATLGAGDYAEAEQQFAAILAAGLADTPPGPHVGLVYARALRGDIAGALAQASRVSAAQGGRPPTAAISTEPVAYALGLAAELDDVVSAWAERTQRLLAGEWTTANHHALGYTMAILDTLAGRDDARERWLSRAHPDSIARPYRFAAHQQLFEILEAERAGDRDRLAALATDGDDLAVSHFAAGARATLDGDLTTAEAELAAALTSSRSGELDCVSAFRLAELQHARGAHADAAATCRRVREPFVPRASCLLLAPRCQGSGTST